MLEEETSLPPLSELADSIPDVLAPSFTFSFIRLNADITIDVPARLQNDPLIRALVKYFNSPWHARKDRCIVSLNRYKKALNLFFNNTLAEFDDVPDTIGERWIYTLKGESDSENTSRMWNFSIKAPLNRISKRLDVGVIFSKEEIAAVSKFNKSWPSLKWNQSNPNKTLEELSDLDVTNAELFASLRVFCQWYIQEWASVMKRFKERMPEEYQAIKTDINRFGKDSFFFEYSRKIAKKEMIHREIERRGSFPPSERATGLAIWIKAAIKLDSVLLKDMVYLAFRLARHETHPENLSFDSGGYFAGFASPVEIEERDQYLKELLPFKWDAKTPQLPPATALVSPSFEMQMATAWLLASDRHQASNLNLMTLSSIRKINNSVSTIVEISSFKGRNNTTLVNAAKIKDSGETYKSNHPIHKALWAYRETAEQAYQEGFFIKDEEALDSQMLLPFIPLAQGLSVKKQKKYCDSDIGNDSAYDLDLGKPRNLGLLTAVTPNTVVQQINAEDGRSAFSDLLGHAMFHNEKHKAQKHSVQTAPMISITPTYIAGTEPVAKLRRRVSLSENMNLSAGIDSDDQKDENQLEAMRANHSVDVRQNVYVARSNDKIKLEAESRFAQMVGEEMVAAAMSLLDIKLEKSSVLTVADVSKKLGLSVCTNDDLESLETLLAESSAQNYLIDVTGLIQKDAELIVIKTPIVAALMQSYIIHIDTTLDQVFSSNEDLVEGLIAHRMFLQAMLNEFDEKTKREAKERFGDAVFPFPELIA